MNIFNNITKLKLKSLSENPNFTPRDLINHDAVAAIIKNNSNQILLLDHIKYNFWTIPIGKVEYNQTPKFAIIQEMFEELGIKIINLKLLNITPRIYNQKTVKINVNEYLFEIISYSGVPQNLEPLKHRSVKWFNLEQIRLLNNISNFTRTMLTFYS